MRTFAIFLLLIVLMIANSATARSPARVIESFDKGWGILQGDPPWPLHSD